MIDILIKYSAKFWKDITIVVLIIVVSLLAVNSCSKDSEIDRLTDNYYAMCDTAKVYETKAGYLAVQTKNQTLTIDELSAQYTDARNTINDLNLKIKNLEQYQNGVVTKEIHDTIFMIDTVINGLYAKTGTYCDKCTNLTFTVDGEYSYFDFYSTDIIDIAITSQKEGKWWKFWNWPRPVVNTTTAVSQCPNTKVEINTCIIK